MKNKKYEVMRSFTVEAAHFLNGHYHCGRVHGHSFKIELHLRGESLADKNMLIDFLKLDLFISCIKDHLDHTNLNDSAYLNCPDYPTAEAIAETICTDLVAYLMTSQPSVFVHKVVVWETPDCCAAVYAD